MDVVELCDVLDEVWGSHLALRVEEEQRHGEVDVPSEGHLVFHNVGVCHCCKLSWSIEEPRHFHVLVVSNDFIAGICSCWPI